MSYPRISKKELIKKIKNLPLAIENKIWGYYYSHLKHIILNDIFWIGNERKDFSNRIIYDTYYCGKKEIIFTWDIRYFVNGINHLRSFDFYPERPLGIYHEKNKIISTSEYVSYWIWNPFGRDERGNRGDVDKIIYHHKSKPLKHYEIKNQRYINYIVHSGWTLDEMINLFNQKKRKHTYKFKNTMNDWEYCTGSGSNFF